MGIEKKVDSHVVVKKREKGKVGRMTGVGLDLANGRVKWVRVKKTDRPKWVASYNSYLVF